MTKLSITASCYNEEKNLDELYQRIMVQLKNFPQLDYEIILADNGSTDGTLGVLRSLAARDSRVKVIVNSRNFGPHRSTYNAFRRATGDGVITMASDLQDPPELITDFVSNWLGGEKIVIAIKNKSKENPVMFLLRRIFYRVIKAISEVEMIENFTGFGLYDKKVYEHLTAKSWPVPYIRGLVSEIGYKPVKVYFTQERRKYGRSSYTLLKYIDFAIYAMTSMSKVPLRLATLCGSFLAFVSFLAALFYLVTKLLFWYNMPVGIAPLVIGLFFFSSVQLLFIGLMGEYVLQILLHIDRKPLVVERESINFDGD